MQLEITGAAKEKVAHRGQHQAKGHELTGITAV